MKSSLLSNRLQASLCLFISILVSVSAFGQVTRQWMRFFDSPLNSWNQADAVVADDAGNVYVTGESSGNNVWDIVTIKYNSIGTQEWVALYDGFHGVDYPTSITIDKEGNIYVAGVSEGNGTSYDMVTIKYNNAGVQQWAVRYNSPDNGSEHAFGRHGIKVDNNGNVYAIGIATRNNNTEDYLTIKYNSQGVQQWVQYYNGSGNGLDWAFAMALDPVTADVYVTGITKLANSFSGYATVKYNSAGVQQWIRTYGEPPYVSGARAIALDAQGNVYVTGSSSGYASGCVTIKYDASGIEEWTAHYVSPANGGCTPNSLGIDRYGNVYITGFSSVYIEGTNPNQYKNSCFTLKYNSAGIQQWAQLQSGTGNASAEGTALALDDEGNVYVTGITDTSGTNLNRDYMILKYNPEGVRQWIDRYDAFGNNDEPADIAVNKFHDVFVTGTAARYVNSNPNRLDYDYLTIKYVQSKPLIVTARPDTTVYVGYGSTCVLLKAEVSGGVAPYTYTWSGGNTPNKQTTTVCPTTSALYTVIAKDATGNTDTAYAAINVVDVRCGNQNNKVMICHKGNELCVAPLAVASHLQHGDRLGSCGGSTINSAGFNELLNSEEIAPLVFKVFPNPFNHVSTLTYQLPLEAQVTITLLDVHGREIRTIVREKKRAGYYTGFINAEKLVPGTYLCRIVISSPSYQSIHTQKLIVVK